MGIPPEATGRRRSGTHLRSWYAWVLGTAEAEGPNHVNYPLGVIRASGHFSGSFRTRLTAPPPAWRRSQCGEGPDPLGLGTNRSSLQVTIVEA
jgi:hypothetical protein